MPPNEICLCGHKRHLHAPERGAASNLEGVGACSMIGYNPSTHEGMPCGCRFFRTAETVNVAIAGTGEGRLIVDDPHVLASTPAPSVMTDAHIREAAKLLGKIATRENDIAAIELDIKRQQDDVTRYRSDIDTMKAQVDIYRAGRNPDDDMPF